jgi:N-methylhydantoinase B/oxoprolinase/acetone carboxylase alpha subunit
MAREQSELEKAKLLAKPIEALSLETPLLFNGCKLVKDSDGDGITMI